MIHRVKEPVSRKGRQHAFIACLADHRLPGQGSPGDMALWPWVADHHSGPSVHQKRLPPCSYSHLFSRDLTVVRHYLALGAQILYLVGRGFITWQKLVSLECEVNIKDLHKPHVNAKLPICWHIPSVLSNDSSRFSRQGKFQISLKEQAAPNIKNIGF